MATVYTLSDLSQDFDQFVNQFQVALSTQSAWQGNLTTQTSQTLTELVSAVGTLNQGRIIRASEDAFSQTAQSDDAILTIAQMQGLRLTRYLPASAPVVMTSPTTVSLSPLSQFTVAGSPFFNRDAITLVANIPTTVTLFQGTVKQVVIAGLGTDRQFYVTPEDSFTVSDQDVIVQVNSITIDKSFGVLWNFDGLPGFADVSTFDGRAMFIFGNAGGVSGQFGTIPQVNDVVTITYVVTTGVDGNSLQTSGKTVTTAGFPLIQGVMQTNPTGGASDKQIVAYKNVAAGSFGTYESAVTKNQYTALVATYPGIVDAVTQAQREIDPNDLRWMNIIRVSALTTSSWTQAQIQDFLTYLQKITMYSGYFLWQEAIPVPRIVDVDVYIYNSADPTAVKLNSTTALTNLFAPRPGLLMTDFYDYDLKETIANANPGLISYVKVNAPTSDMIVTAPPSPPITYTLLPGGGELGELVYAYSISSTVQYTDSDGNVTTEVGIPQNWVFPQVITNVANYAIQLAWEGVDNATQYQVWGRAVTTAGTSSLGLLATIPVTSATQVNYTFIDTGAVTPTGTLPTSQDFPIKYNQLESLTVNVYYSNRQQRQPGEDPTRLLGG